MGKYFPNRVYIRIHYKQKFGCDSICQLQLTVYPTYKDTINATICYGETYSIGGLSVNSQGIYTDSLKTIHNCDSIIVLNLKVISFENVAISDTVNICQGEKTTIEVSGYPDNSSIQWSNGSSYARQKFLLNNYDLHGYHLQVTVSKSFDD